MSSKKVIHPVQEISTTTTISSSTYLMNRAYDILVVVVGPLDHWTVTTKNAASIASDQLHFDLGHLGQFCLMIWRSLFLCDRAHVGDW